MLTVALIGGDGAGKTTIAKRLEQSSRLPIKYLYMGVSTQSSNHSLLTSRLALLLRIRASRKGLKESGVIEIDKISARDLEWGPSERSPIWLSLRCLNRLAEAWYRQLLSVIYQMRGYVVVYDRHFLFETAPLGHGFGRQKRSPLDGLYYWIMDHLYPKPRLVILLDAPVEMLYERKREATLDHLNKQRQVCLEEGKKVEKFVRIDAAQPIEKVFEEVLQQIERFSITSNVRNISA
jgi:thymidylate kinase